jgi:N4-gp56 family major capsid protein
MAISTYPTMTGGINTTTDANFIPEIWADELLVSREANLVAGKLFDRVDHKGKAGDTIHFPFLSDFAAQDYTQLAGVTIQNVTEGVKSISLNKYKDVSWLESNLAQLQRKDAYKLRQRRIEKAGYALAKAIDSDILGLYSSLGAGYQVIGGDGSTAWSNSGSGNGSNITDAGLLAIIRKLDDNDAPADDRFMIIPPCQKQILLGIDKFVLYQNIGRNTELVKGKFGELYGMPVYVSTNCPTVAAADTTTNYRVGIIAHKSAFAIAMQQDVKVQAQYKQEYKAHLMSADCVYGVQMMRGDAADTSASNYRLSHAVAFYVPA